MRTTDFPVRQIERMTERSGARSVSELLRKIERTNTIERIIRGIIFGGLPKVISGILIPRDIATGTIFTPEELERERAKQLKPIEVPKNVKRISNIPEPFRDRALREIVADIPAKRLDPVRTRPFEIRDLLPTGRAPQTPRQQSPQQTTRRAPSPIRSPFPTGTTIGVITSSIISRLIRTRGTRPAPFRDPIQPPLGRPFVPTTPGPTTQPLPTRTRAPTINDLCRAQAQRQRKKRRKCNQRLNVVWASGPNKGKIAGTKCATFEDTF